MVNNSVPEKRTFKGIKKYVKLYRVYDGDTIEIITKLDFLEKPKRYMLRLNGIDTPELKPKIQIQNRSLIIETSEKIKIILSKILTPILYVEFDGEDKYGRLLGRVWTIKYNFCCCKKIDINVNTWLLSNRLAVPYNGQKKIEFSKQWLTSNITNINSLYKKYNIQEL